MDKYIKVLNLFNDWRNIENLDDELKEDLDKLNEKLQKNSNDKKTLEEIYDRFYCELKFGTAGMRGIMGAGTNRMNIPIIKRVSKGFAEWIISRKVRKVEKEYSCVIAFDTRHNSLKFALIAKTILENRGIKVHLFKKPTPTPILSFAVSYLKASAGIVITASHNSKEYNGYKIYNETGTQCSDMEANAVLKKISTIKLFENDDFSIKKDFDIKKDEMIYNAFYSAVLKYNGKIGMEKMSNSNIAYTPLNGTGLYFILNILEKIGVKKINIVEEQKAPDENFSSAPFPNPENKEALKKGLELCYKLKKEGNAPDILIATDPDADRVGIAVFDGSDDYKIFTGNEIGILIYDYLINRAKKNNSIKKNTNAISTIVSTPLFLKLSNKNNLTTRETLTGFKNIGKIMNDFFMDGILEENIFNFEESCGYLIGNYARDKDGIGTTMILAELIAYYKAENKTAVKRMNEIYEENSFIFDEQLSFIFNGESGERKIKKIMATLIRLELSDKIFPGKNLLKKENISGVIRLFFTDARICLRPSGTEPKLKFYISSQGESRKISNKILLYYKERINKFIEDYE
ncbi:MAG: phospho-sugar mutase [Clostridiales Family XIII bacterium]|jgi:phosphoglucomutase|nr:phospho-sugar mutase [Clostridiales Family XIII bacterium]